MAKLAEFDYKFRATGENKYVWEQIESLYLYIGLVAPSCPRQVPTSNIQHARGLSLPPAMPTEVSTLTMARSAHLAYLRDETLLDAVRGPESNKLEAFRRRRFFNESIGFVQLVRVHYLEVDDVLPSHLPHGLVKKRQR
jgi:hypothetical protein